LTGRSDLVGGVDEAGRGCVVGPLMVAGVCVRADEVKVLRELGVKDSKKLSPDRREALYPQILEVCRKVSWESIGPAEIDRAVRRKRTRKLNYLEAVYFAKVIDKLGAHRVTVDASDTVPERFRDYITGSMSRSCDVLAVHKADRDYPVVAAASIIAKVRRDAAVEELRRQHGDFGSGYPSDPVTRSFFAARLRRGDPLPGFVRKSWKTWERLEQSHLFA
jgi:ribonuclease HII